MKFELGKCHCDSVLNNIQHVLENYHALQPPLSGILFLALDFEFHLGFLKFSVLLFATSCLHRALSQKKSYHQQQGFPDRTLHHLDYLPI